MSMQPRKDCPYCGTKLVPAEDPQTDEKYIKCLNCGYKINYSIPETTKE